MTVTGVEKTNYRKKKVLDSGTQDLSGDKEPMHLDYYERFRVM